jgi:ribosomal protein S18 acetylase RimI-like enzyme
MDQYTLSLIPTEKLSQYASPLLHWFQSPSQLHDWAGPGIDFPLTEDDFSLIGQRPSFSLDSQTQPLLGFGQYYLRLERQHLARLVINPEFRGQGLGRVLVTALLEHAQQRESAREASLFVEPSNRVAIALYSSLGFIPQAYPDNTALEVLPYTYMVKAL